MSVPRDLDALTPEVDDPQDLLRAIAGSGARLRAADADALAAGLGEPTDRPRSLVIGGRDALTIAAAVRALAGPTCPVPILAHEGPGLPGFVGALDLVVLCSSWPDDLAAAGSADEAGRRGARLVTIAPLESPVGGATVRARGLQVALPRGPLSLWSMLMPVLHAAAAARVLSLLPQEVTAAADRLDAVAVTSRPDAESFSNPAKALGSAVSEGIPVLWGTTGITAAAARHGSSALTELAGLPGLAGLLPEPGDAALGVLVSAAVGSSGDELEDLFRDRVDDDGDERQSVALIVVRDPGEEPWAATRADVIARVAAEQRHAVHVIAAAGESLLERLASVVGLLDLAAVYAALAAHRVPGAADVAEEVGARVRRRL